MRLHEKTRCYPQKTALNLIQIIHEFKDLDELKYVHNAIRSENILLHEEADGQLIAKLSNFLFAKTYDSLPGNKEQMPYDSLYLSPEVLKKLKYTPKSDVWALGVLYCEMLYAKTPWTGNSMKELEEAILRNRLEFSIEAEGTTETA